MANDFMNCRMRTSFRLLGMPHRKKRVVTRKNGSNCSLGKIDLLFAQSLASVVTAAFVACMLARPSSLYVPDLSVQANHDLLDPQWIVAPGAQCLWCFVQRNDRADRIVDRKATFFEHSDHRMKVFGQSIS